MLLNDTEILHKILPENYKKYDTLWLLDLNTSVILHGCISSDFGKTYFMKNINDIEWEDIDNYLDNILSESFDKNYGNELIKKYNIELRKKKIKALLNV